MAIPAGKFQFKVSGVEIEGRDEPGVDVQYPWEDLPHRHHDHTLDITRAQTLLGYAPTWTFRDGPLIESSDRPLADR